MKTSMWLKLKILLGYVILLLLLVLTIHIFRKEQTRRNSLRQDEHELACIRHLAGETYAGLLGLATDYSIKGQLLGHLVMGAQDAAETAARLGVPEEKSVLLQHLILSHHGEPEFGAAVRPLCAEAELLSLIDAVDSRMEIYRETYDTMEPDTFSPRIFALEKKVFRHA